MVEIKAAGRPLKFQSVEELEKKIDAYFEYCDEKGKPYTISGLAYFLDTSRRVLLEYGQKEVFSNTISRAKHRIAAFTEENLYQPKITQGIIFSLKNNFGWRDDKHLDLTTGGEKLGFVSLPPEPETKLENKTIIEQGEQSPNPELLEN